MTNPIHRSVGFDRKLMVDGVTFHEYKELNIVSENGVKETQFSHLRYLIYIELLFTRGKAAFGSFPSMSKIESFQVLKDIISMN